jgi:hypothetical protein
MDGLLQQFSCCFTQPSMQTFLVVATGWLMNRGRRTVTRVLLSGEGLALKSFCCYHRFFSQARWSLDAIGQVVFAQVLRFIPDGVPLKVAVDDTLTRKSGKRIWGAAMHHDPLLSAGRRAFFSFGHNWVVLSIQVSFSFAPNKVWSLPILMRLYRCKQKPRKPGRPPGERKAIGQTTPREHRTRPELAREMIAILASWVPDRTIYVLGDSAYAGKSISRYLPDNAHLVSRMVMDAGLYEPPPKRHQKQRGAPRKKGKRLPSPKKLAESRAVKWKKTRANLYSKSVRVWYKSCVALWYNSAGTRRLKVVVVRDPSGRRKDDCFFCTDLSRSPKAILELFAARWPLEVAFYNAKQHLGFEDPQNRAPRAVERTAPMALYMHDLVILWFADHGRFDLDAYRKRRPWYRHKRTPSFEDMIQGLRRESWKKTISQHLGQEAPTNKFPRKLLDLLDVAA